MKGTTVLDKTEKVGIMEYCYQFREGRRAPGTVTVGVVVLVNYYSQQIIKFINNR
jgi:hypothetical protein